MDSAYSAYQRAKTDYDQAKADLQSAMTSSGYTEAVSQYESYKQKMETAATSHKNAQRTTESRLTSLTTAQKNAEEALKKYNEGGTSDELDTLRETLDKCTVTASAAGTVTAVSATVGSMISDSSSVATIQETENLLVAITLEEYDVKNVAVGMACEITSDATEGAIPGVVSTISPTSSQSGGFAAEVEVQGGSNGLLIGMNAQVEIILNSVEDVFTVPADAVGSDEEGSYILVRTSGTGADAVFERVAVTVGESNDYYVIVEGEGLSEGMVVRATADLSVGAETTDDAAAAREQAGGMALPGLNIGGMQGGAPGGNMGGGPSGGPGGERPGGRGGN